VVWFPAYTACSNVIVQSSFIYLDPLRDGTGERNVNIRDSRSLDANQPNRAVVNLPFIIWLNHSFISDVVPDFRSKEQTTSM